jgi:hypothetical protein
MWEIKARRVMWVLLAHKVPRVLTVLWVLKAPPEHKVKKVTLVQLV